MKLQVVQCLYERVDPTDLDGSSGVGLQLLLTVLHYFALVLFVQLSSIASL